MDSKYNDFRELFLHNKYLTIRPAVKLFIKIAICFIFLLPIFIIFAKWTPAISGTGKLIAYNPNERIQDIEAPIEGRIEKWLVSEGSQVKKGETLANISDIDPNRLSRLENQQQAVKDKLLALNLLKEKTIIHVNRLKSLVDEGIESQRNLDLAEIELFKVDTDINKVKIQLEELKSSISRQKSQRIQATIDGVILKIYAPVKSQIVKTGEIITTIAPLNTNPAAEIYVSGIDLPLIKQNQPSRLVFEGWPFVQIVGWPSTAIGTFPGQVTVINQAEGSNGKFRILITPPPGESWPVNNNMSRFNVGLGSKVKAWIQLKPVPIWWEIWRRFSGVPPRV